MEDEDCGSGVTLEKDATVSHCFSVLPAVNALQKVTVSMTKEIQLEQGLLLSGCLTAERESPAV